jgi:hypothetical protein
VFAAALVWPEKILEKDAYPSVLVLAAALGAGFVVQQLTRTIFEGLRGYRRRPVIEEIRRAYSIDKRYRHNLPQSIWEMVLYSEDIKEGFREHNRRMWHYIWGFLATAFSFFLGLCLLLGAHCWFKRINHVWGWSIFFLFLALLFLYKARLTCCDLRRQELACFHLYRPHFDRAYEKLSGEILWRQELPTRS